MYIKKLMILLISCFSFLFVSNKISAVTIAECDYGERTLLLPVTIGVNITGINNFFPFQEIYNTYETKELLVYDSNTCKSTLQVPSSNYEYLYTYSYYYKYNSEITYVDFIGNGTYSEVDLTPPTITSYLENPLTFNVDKKVDLDYILSLLSVIDNRDKQIIPEVTFDGYSDNYNKIGTYSIIYKACDSSNNCSNYILKINVIDKTPPIIEGKTTIDSYLSNPLSLSDISSSLIANDNHDGNISEKITITKNNYNNKKVGNYYAYFSVCDISGNMIQQDFKVTIIVHDDISPTIEGASIFKSYLSSPLQTNEIIASLIVNDNEDQNVYNNIYTISDSYSKNINKLGTYNIIIGTYDSSGNESLPFVIEVTTYDDLSPTIEGKKIYETYLSNPLSLLEIKSNLIIYDNYDGNLFNEVEIVDDNYSINKNKIGVFYINFMVKDFSGNTSSPFIIEIHVFDDILPIIEGNNLYTSFTSEKIDILSLKLNLNASDNIDGNISENIVVNDDFYSNNSNVPGSYFVTFYVCDSSGNISNFFRVKIIVNEYLTFIDTLNNSYLYFDNKAYVSDEKIFDMLSIENTNYLSFTTITNEYASNYNIEGCYKIIYEFENLDYTTSTLELNIVTTNVNDEKNSENKTVTEKKKETIFTKIISFFANIFSNIGTFFKRLFN